MDSRTRAICVLLLLACGFTVISFNLIQIQLVQHQKYIAMARELHDEQVQTPPKRGTIYDAEGNVLAESQRVYDVHLDGKLESDGLHLAAIAAALGQPVSRLTESFDPKNRNIPLATSLTIDDPAIQKLEDLKLRSVKIESHDERTYPNAQLAAHVLGFIDDGTNRGMAGMEKDLDKLLTGTPGERWVERDAKRQEVPAYQTKETPAIDGDNVTLTIRLGIQHVVEEELDQIAQTYSPNAAYIVVMDPHTGEILGMGSRPTYDPNNRKTFGKDNITNGCIINSAEPGSIFKIITLSAALNENLVGLDTPINCENGEWTYAGRELHDDESLGVLPVIEAFAHSSNIAMAKLGANYLGKERLYNYARAFGIGQPTGLFGGQGETAGILRKLKDWSALSVSRIPMGQEVMVTPIQMVTAMSVIANGGKFIEPHLVKQIADADGNVIETIKPQVLRRVISARAAQLTTKALQQVLIDGTAKAIHVPGWERDVAGKTGTAQKVVNGQYSHTQHVSSFIGFMPADDPAFVALVMVDSPRTKAHQDYGAQVSAPIFANLAQQVAQLMNLTPPQPVTPPATPSNLTTLTSNATTTEAKP